MNLLAHAILAHLSFSKPDPLALSGSLMADYFRGENLDDYPHNIGMAIRQHRAIDAYTDAHPGFQYCHQLVATRAPRLTANILTDLFWGHVLARHWDEYGRPHCGLDLTGFCQKVYAAIEETKDWHGAAFARASGWLVGYRWLELYASVEGIAVTLDGLSRRLSRAQGLPAAISILEEQYPALHAAFDAFWPEVVAFSQQWLEANPGPRPTSS